MNAKQLWKYVKVSDVTELLLYKNKNQYGWRKKSIGMEEERKTSMSLEEETNNK